MATPSLAQQAALAGDYPGYEFNKREQKVLASVKVYVDALSPEVLITTEGDVIVGGAAGIAQRLAKGSSGLPLVAGASTVSYAQLAAAGIASDAVITAKILNANVTLAKLASGIAPSHVVKFGSRFTTLGGAAAEAITLTGALSSDLAFVRLVNDGTANVTISSWAMTADTLTVTFSGDPGNDAIIEYVVYRAAA
jgi:hypothetical protein